MMQYKFFTKSIPLYTHTHTQTQRDWRRDGHTYRELWNCLVKNLPQCSRFLHWHSSLITQTDTPDSQTNRQIY